MKIPNAMDCEPEFSQWMLRLTQERLHAKGDIAAVLADQERRIASITKQRDNMRFVLAAATNTLRRYRNESPPGHQPHMICHVADDVLAKAEAALQGAR